MNIDFTCTKDWILQDVPHQIWEATTADGQGANVIITRILHNKPLFYANNFTRCYLSYLSPDFINATFSIIGLALFLLGLYQAVQKKNKLIFLLILIAPIFPLFSFPKSYLLQGIILYGLESVIIFYGIWQLLKQSLKRFHAF